MTKSIHHKFFFPHPPEVVWEYLTKPELIELWLMKNNFQPKVGHDFQFRTNPLPNFNFDGIVHCKVVQITPCQKLSYSWKGGPGQGQITLDSVVVWTLVPKEGGTELVLEHSGFMESNELMYTIMTEGWIKNIQRIGDLIKNKPEI